MSTENSENDIFFESIPEELKEYNQWVCWEYQIREGKPTKVPIDAKKSRYARVNNPQTWATYDEVCNYYRKHKDTCGGIGFVFSINDPFIGIDWDGIRDPITGVINDETVRSDIISIGSYAEISPSGKGIHVIAKGTIPGQRRRKGPLEMYSEGRYFTITGRHLEGTPHTIEVVLHPVLDKLYKKVDPPQSNTTQRYDCSSHREIPIPEFISSISDDEVIDKCLSSPSGEKFELICEGEYEKALPGVSRSEIDLSFCSMVTSHTIDKTQIDRIFRDFGPYREKWDQRRGLKTYGEITIEKAIHSRLERTSASQANDHEIIKRRFPLNFDEEVDLWEI